MSFLRPDDGQDQTDNQATQVITGGESGADSSASSDSTSQNTNKDVTVTTDEGSTLHTFNDPTLQAAVNDASTNDNAQPSQSDQASDPLTFQDHDGTPLDAVTSTPDSSPTDTDNAPADNPTNAVDSSDSSAPTSSFNPSVDASSGDPALDGIKREALEQLRPLLEKVDLPASEKFDKYLMMIRATDDPTLIEPAFKAAQGISEEKEKAEALVDIINEINYVSGDH